MSEEKAEVQSMRSMQINLYDFLKKSGSMGFIESHCQLSSYLSTF